MATHSGQSDAAEIERKVLEERRATDKVSGLPHTILKPIYGAEGSRTFVTDAAPFPVTTTTVVSGTIVTPKFAKIDLATTTSTEIVAAVSGKKIRVIYLWLLIQSGTSHLLDFLSNTTEIAGPYVSFASTTIGLFPVILEYNTTGHFETTSNEALKLKMSANTLTAGHLVYTEV